MRKLKILVTGGLGFIGSNFIRYLMSKNNDAEVINLDKVSFGANYTNLRDVEGDRRYRFVKGDIADFKHALKLTDGIDVIVNFAAETHVDRSISNPKAFFRSNTLGTFMLLEAARKRGVHKFIHVSTDEVYGAAVGESSFKKSNMPNPSNPYSASKASADMFVRAYHTTYGIHTVIGRCTNNFGPYQHPEKLIPKTIIRTLKGLPIPLYGTGSQVRDWIYVMDHCEALTTLMEKGRPGETYNISAGNELSNIRVVRLILEMLDKPQSLIERVEDRPGHDVRYSLNSSKIRTELGWRPTHSFEEALRKTIEWYVKNEWWWIHLATDEALHPTPWKLRW